MAFDVIQEDGSLPSIPSTKKAVLAFMGHLRGLSYQEPKEGEANFKLWVNAVDGLLVETQARRVLCQCEIAWEIFDTTPNAGDHFNTLDGLIQQVLVENGELKTDKLVVRYLTARSPMDVKTKEADWPKERF